MNLPYVVNVQYSSLALIPSKDANTLGGSLEGTLVKVGEQAIPFTVSIQVKQVAAPPYSIYKNSI